MPEVLRLNVLIPGLYAWGATVAFPCVVGGFVMWPALVAWLGLVALLVGAWVSPKQALVGRLLGVHTFLGCAALSWILLGERITPAFINPVHGLSGVLGWALFAFGWGATRVPERIPEEDPRADATKRLKPRGRAPRVALPLTLLMMAAALGPLAAAWLETRPAHAFLAHAAALVASLGILGVGPQLAVSVGGELRLPSPAARLQQASTALTWLGLAAVAALIVELL